MSDAKLVNIARLMTTYNLEIEQLPDNLKCAQCKLVLKDACQLPCCCRYCRVCIDDMIERGGEFCPGGSDECGESLLSSYQSDYSSNRTILKLTIKCPYDGCAHETQLANMDDHVRECPRRTEKCPFYELGCTQDKLAAEEMGGHLQHDNRRHSEILIKMMANINMEIETLNRRDEASSREIATLKLRDEASSREIATLKLRDEASSREIEKLKNELVLKDEQIRSIMGQMKEVQNENKTIKNDLKSIKEEIERETAERRENRELDMTRVIEHVDKEIIVVTGLIGINQNKMATEIQAVKGDIASINRDTNSVKVNIGSLKWQVQLIQELVGLGQVDARCVWLIDVDIDNTDWGWRSRPSKYFTGTVHPYKYRLTSVNFDIGTNRAVLSILFRIDAGPNDEQLPWPFEARVVITVTDRDRHEACRSISRQCRIVRPPDNDGRRSEVFKFFHSELRGAGLNLSRGVRVSCMIVQVPVHEVIDTTFHWPLLNQ